MLNNVSNYHRENTIFHMSNQPQTWRIRELSAPSVYIYMYIYMYVQTHPNCLGGPNFDPPNPTTVWVQYFGWDGWDPSSSLAQGAQESWRPLQWNSWPSEGMATANLKWSMWPRPGAMTIIPPDSKLQVVQCRSEILWRIQRSSTYQNKTLNRRINQINQQQKHTIRPNIRCFLWKCLAPRWKPHDLRRWRLSISWHLTATTWDLTWQLFQNPPEGVGVFLGKMDG